MLPFGMTKRPVGGPQQTGRGYQGSARTAQGKVEPRTAIRWRGWLRAGQEGATTAVCPSPVCPAPSGGPKGSGLAVGEPSQGGTIRNGEGGLGGREEPGVRTLLRAGGGRHTLGKRLGHIQNRPISKQSRGGVKGQLRPMKRKNTSEVRRKKWEKKKPHETTIESVWGLGRRGVGVVYVMFPFLPAALKNGWLTSLYCFAAQTALRRVPRK